MTNYFVDSTNGNDTDDGTTMDAGGGGGTGAWATLTHAMAQALNPGDRVWIRRVHSEALSGAVGPLSDGTIDAQIHFAGWPRAADATADGATWTNGSETVDLVTTLTMDLEKHVGRFVTAPDGNDYLITAITDGNTFVIDREYAGSTVTLTDGAFTIKADEDWADDMGTTYGFDDSGWTIKEAAWDADADDLPLFDCGGAANYFYPYTDHFIRMAYMHVKDGTGTACLYIRGQRGMELEGILLTQASQNAPGIYVRDCTLSINRLIFIGSGSGGTQKGIYFSSTNTVRITNSALYSCGDTAFYATGQNIIYLENVNLGVEGANADFDIAIDVYTVFTGRDVKFGGNVGEIYIIDTNVRPGVCASLENYNKILGSHKSWNLYGEITKVDVVAGSGDPYKRTGGNDSVVEVAYNHATIKNPEKSYAKFTPIFVHEYEVNATGSQSYRYYVQSEGAITAGELWLEAEYISNYDDTGEYVVTIVSSDEAITARDDASDWDQYIEVTGISPAILSKVRITCYSSYNDATKKFYIDPKMENP